MKVLICDDDYLFAKRLGNMVEQYYRQHQLMIECQIYKSPSALLEGDDLQNFQVAFLDVDMTPINGIELGERLKKQNPAIVLLYVSAYLEFAIQGYTVNAFRYILKRDIKQTLEGCLDSLLQSMNPEGDCLIIKQRGENFRIPLEEIYYMESNLRKVSIYGDSLQTPQISFYAKIDDYRYLEQKGFLRIGQSHLVNMRHIKRVLGYNVTLRNGEVLPMSRNNSTKIKARYLDWLGSL